MVSLQRGLLVWQLPLRNVDWLAEWQHQQASGHVWLENRLQWLLHVRAHGLLRVTSLKQRGEQISVQMILLHVFCDGEQLHGPDGSAER